MGLINYLSNIPGWSTQRKIVVIESDDWGSLRAPSNQGLNEMKKSGLPLGKKDGIRFNKYDDLASASDLGNLFEVLSSFKDINEQSAKMTALSLVANPDFEKIIKDNYKLYHYEPIIKSLERQNKKRAWDLWREGYKSNLFIPEFHGREHLNVKAWMRALQNKNKIALEGFKYEFWGFRTEKNHISFQAAFDLEKKEDLVAQHDILEDGLKLFKSLHHRNACFFVPPNGPINNALEKTASTFGIQYISSPKIQDEALGEGKTKKHFRYLGKQNKHGQLYLTRNAFFEPSNPSKTDWVDACLSQIETAFKFKKPATISSHRVNYIGSRDLNNRDYGLKELKKLLDTIIKTWPNVEFMSSSDLGSLINTK